MADLLECLIQIKALRLALDLATGPAGADGPFGGSGAAGTEVWRPAADAEQRYAEALGTDDGTGPALSGEPAGWPDARAAFVSRRRANLARLEGCTGAQLSSFVAWPKRRSTTVADLVAIMLGSDTELLAGLRLGARQPAPRPS